jgi:type II secretory pathway pseudopilin PulG
MLRRKSCARRQHDSEQAEKEMALFCAACGNNMAAEDRFCRVCGRAVVAPGAPPTSVPLTPALPRQNSGKAVASLVFGLLFVIPFAFIAAIVFGHVALSEIKRSAGRLKGEGMAIAGLVLGYLWIVFIPIILIVAAIAIPNLLRARIAANETSAVASVRTLNVAEISYASAHPSTGFTCSFSDLSSLIDASLASGRKNGYQFELSGCTANESGVMDKYQVVAYPITPNTTGVRAFCSDESSVIKVDSSGSSQGCLENGPTLQ